jgi:uncharacterized membrane protein
MQLAVSRKNQFAFAAAGLAAGAAVIAIRSLSRARAIEPATFAIGASVVVKCLPEDAYRYCRNFENLAGFLSQLDNVAEFEGTCVWTAQDPTGVELTWDAEIVADRANERIAWRSLEGARLANHGSVTFKPALHGRGTEVHLELAFEPPLGPLGSAVVELFGKRPQHGLLQSLRRFRQVMEAGEFLPSGAFSAPP